MPENVVTTKRACDMRDHYDFSKGVRGKYAKRFEEGTNLVVLDPDLAEKFPDSESVNRALRRYLEEHDITSQSSGSR